MGPWPSHSLPLPLRRACSHGCFFIGDGATATPPEITPPDLSPPTAQATSRRWLCASTPGRRTPTMLELSLRGGGRSWSTSELLNAATTTVWEASLAYSTAGIKNKCERPRHSLTGTIADLSPRGKAQAKPPSQKPSAHQRTTSSTLLRQSTT